MNITHGVRWFNDVKTQKIKGTNIMEVEGLRFAINGKRLPDFMKIWVKDLRRTLSTESITMAAIVRIIVDGQPTKNRRTIGKAAGM